MNGGDVVVRFPQEEIDLFRRASHDRNPLHRSADYARRTPFGEPVVFGVLAAFHCLARMGVPPGQMPKRVTASFPTPAFRSASYRTTLIREQPDQTTVRMADGRRTVCRLSVTWQRRHIVDVASDLEAEPPRCEAKNLDADAIQPGLAFCGTYAPDRAALVRLVERLGHDVNAIPVTQLGVLLWTSYLVGMQLPGREALFSRLDLVFEGICPTGDTAFECKASVRSFDRRFGVLRLQVKVAQGGHQLARGSIEAFLREPPDKPPRTDWSARPAATILDPRTAIVIGASRGLGASIALALAHEGWTVYASYLRCREEAEALRKLTEKTAGCIVPIQGDGADLNWCRSLCEKVLSERASIDLLVCNACPALQPLWLEPECVDRMNRYIHDSVALVTAPLASFVQNLDEAGGWAVVISSQTVSEPRADWPHYVAAKHALEGLARVAAMERRRIGVMLVRPPRLRTQLADSPVDRASALAPKAVAQGILLQLAAERTPGEVQIVYRFPDSETGGERVTGPNPES